MFIDEEIIETWRGAVQYIENHISVTEDGSEDGSYNIENNYSVLFKDIDSDGEIDIIQEGEEKREEINRETREWETKKEIVKNIYKWDKENKKYEKQ